MVQWFVHCECEARCVISRWYESGRMSAKVSNGTWALVVVVVLVTVVLVYFSSVSSDFSSEWYQGLVKPAGLAPAAAFGVVWGVLYLLILVGALYAVLVSTSLEVRVKVVLLYTLALLLTLVWVVAFSQLQQPPAALGVLLLTLVVVGLLIWQVVPSKLREGGTRMDALPGVCFSLLFLWLLVATYYNLSIVAQNPGGGGGGQKGKKAEFTPPTTGVEK